MADPGRRVDDPGKVSKHVHKYHYVLGVVY